MLKVFKYTTLFLTAALAATLGTIAHAQHSDIEAGVTGGQLVIEEGILLNSGEWLFETEFGEGLFPANQTDDPGFEIEGLTPGDFFALEAVGNLQFFDGTSFTATTGTEAISIFGNAGPTTVVDGSSILNPFAIVETATAAGLIDDEHVDFEINGAAAGTYLIEFVLSAFTDLSGTTPAVDSSDSFFIAFNFGLDEEIFESAVDSLGIASEVPVPAAWVFLASGLGSLVAGRRLRAKKAA